MVIDAFRTNDRLAKRPLHAHWSPCPSAFIDDPVGNAFVDGFALFFEEATLWA